MYYIICADAPIIAYISIIVNTCLEIFAESLVRIAAKKRKLSYIYKTACEKTNMLFPCAALPDDQLAAEHLALEFAV